MRTIKFRAKIEGQNTFAYGNLFKNTACTRILPEQAIIDEENRIDERHIVDESTIGQFTGLTDKNGKEIYEGDILSVDKSALDFDFKNSKAGDLMKTRNIDELLIEVKMFEYLQIYTYVFLKKDNSLVKDCDYWELTEEDYKSMKSEDIANVRKPWCERSTDIQFLRYCSKYASIIGNIHDNPELLK